LAELDPFVTREAVQMSRGPHFSSNAKAENELRYVPTSSIDAAVRDAAEDFVARGLAPVAAARLSSAPRGTPFFSHHGSPRNGSENRSSFKSP
jgi:hypothetical protein